MSRLLLVEDDPLVASSTLRILQRYVEVLHVTTVEEALAALEADGFAAVLTDWNLGGGMTGEPVAKACEARGLTFRVYSAELTPDPDWRHVWLAKWNLEGLKAFAQQAKEGGTD